jgi:hypothetical protein
LPGIFAELGHEPGANVVEMKIAAEAKLLQLHFVRAEEFTRSTHRVIDRFVEVIGISHVDSNLRREELRIKGSVFIARIAIQPGPVPI